MRNMESVEFYKTPDGVVMMKPVDQPVRVLHQGCREEVVDLLGLIRDRYPDAFDALCREYTRSEPNRMLYEFNIVSRFIPMPYPVFRDDLCSGERITELLGFRYRPFAEGLARTWNAFLRVYEAAPGSSVSP